MRGDEFLDKMGLVDFTFVEEADRQPVRNRYAWLRWGAMAACAVLIAAFCLWYRPYGTDILTTTETGASTQAQPETENPPEKELPMLTITEDVSAMGFEGYMAYDVSELVNSNPWYEGCGVTELPVYENSIHHSEGEPDFDWMESLLRDVADRLGMEVTEIIRTNNTPDAEIRQKYVESYRERFGALVSKAVMTDANVQASDDNYTIIVRHHGHVVIEFVEGIPLSETETTEALLSQYGEWILFDDPQASIRGGDYNIYGNQLVREVFCEGGATLTEEIVHYNVTTGQFDIRDGMLYGISYTVPSLSHWVGDYPILTTEEATELLLAGQYVTNVMEEMPGEEYIAKVELVYRARRGDAYFIPYYRFYVELPSYEREDPPGLKTYGAYYVPAIEGKYISNMPQWNGQFN